MVIAILASLIRNHFINRIVAVTAWTIAALSIMGLLDRTVVAIDSYGLVFGGIRVTPLLILKTTALLLIAIWAATAVSNFLDRRVQASEDLTPSVQVLLGKLIRIAVMAIAIIVVLSVSGIDLSVFAIATGAVGVGVGLGLQKIVANFVSGIVLLADKSIKPGDVITIGEHFGWVTNMGTRYTSVDLKDGREVLVPNEDLVTQRVINWSYTSDRMQAADQVQHQLQRRHQEDAGRRGRGGAERAAGDEGAGALVPHHGVRRERARVRAVGVDQERQRRTDAGAQRDDDRAVGHVREAGHRDAEARTDTGDPRSAAAGGIALSPRSFRGAPKGANPESS